MRNESVRNFEVDVNPISAIFRQKKSLSHLEIASAWDVPKLVLGGSTRSC